MGLNSLRFDTERSYPKTGGAASGWNLQEEAFLDRVKVTQLAAIESTVAIDLGNTKHTELQSSRPECMLVLLPLPLLF